MALEEGMIL